MGRRKRDKVEFRFYEIPHGESALALLGEAWVGAYGRGEVCLHFHNLFEIGYCHYGHGILILGEDEKPYEDAMISAIPANVLDADGGNQYHSGSGTGQAVVRLLCSGKL